MQRDAAGTSVLSLSADTMDARLSADGPVKGTLSFTSQNHMARQFSKDEKEKIRQLLGLPEGVGRNSKAEMARLPIGEVRRALSLPVMPHSNFLSERCWMGGGRILRWLSGEVNEQRQTAGDFDFFFPTVEALKETTLSMLAAGYEFYRSLARPLTLGDLMTGRRGEREEKASVFGENGDEFSLKSRKISADMEQVGIELTSPEGDIIQLITQIIKPSRGSQTPDDLIANMDFTICQFVMDDQYIYAGPYAWTDLLGKRLRHVYIVDPLYTHWRFHKYMRRGFRPYAETFTKVYQAYFHRWAVLLHWGLRGKRK